MPAVEITTVKAQQQIKSLKDEIRVLFKHMQTLNREFNKQVVMSQRLSNALSGKLTPAEKRVAAVAKSAEAAFVRQAKATNTARERVLNFTQALKLSGATQQQQKFILRGVTQSLTAFDKRMSSGVLTTRQFQEAQDRLTRSLGSARRSLAVISLAQKKQSSAAATAAVASKGLTTTLRNLGSSAIFAVGPLSGIGARLNAFGAIAGRTKLKVALIAVSFVALGVAIFKTIKSMIRVAVETNKIRNALRVATGSTRAAKAEFAFLISISRQLSLDISKVGGQFAKLTAAAKGTSLAGTEVRRIFEAISTASLVLGLSADQTSGALRAIEQIISKGTVQAEELRGQLGERLPGAFQIAARAMKVTTRELGKLLELGLVVSTEFIPKFSAELLKMVEPQVGDAVGQLTATVNKLKTEMFLFFDVLEEKTGIVAGIADVLETLGRGMEVINEALRGTEGAGERFGPPAPSLTFDALRNLPIASVDKFKDSLRDMRGVLKSLQDPSLSIKGKLGVVTEFERIGKVTKEVTKIINKLEGEELEALRTKWDGTQRSMEEVRDILTKLVNRFLDARKAIDETTKSLEKQDKFLKDAEKRFLTTIVPRGAGITRARVGPDTGGSVRALNLRQAFNRSIDETVEKLETANDVLRLRLRGLDEEARDLEIRNRLEELYGDDILREQIERVAEVTKQNKILTEEYREQQREQREAAKAARDFANVIGSAFEDAVIKGNDLRSVLQGLLEDIQRIIFRVLVTKPFETFLTGLLTGEGGGGVGLFTQQTGGISGIVQGLLGLGGSGGGRAATAGTSILGGIGGFAHGGSFKVGGVGGIDQNRVTMDLTRGETVTVTPANQNPATERPVVINIFTRDPDTRVESPGQVALQGMNIGIRAKRRSR